METLWKLSKIVGLALLIICAVVITIDLHSTLHNLDGAVTDVRKTAAAVNSVVSDVDMTMDSVKAAAAKLNTAADSQIVYWQKTSVSTSKTAEDLRRLTARLDRNLNDHLIPDLDAGVIQTAAAAQNSLESIQTAAESLNFQLRDPAITQMAQHLNDAAADVATASDHTAKATGHLENTTADIETAVHRATRPPTLAVRVGSLILSKGAEAAQWVYGYFRK